MSLLLNKIGYFTIVTPIAIATVIRCFFASSRLDWSLSVVGGAGTIYAIILGVNLAKADSEDARKNNLLDKFATTIDAEKVIIEKAGH